MVVLICGLGIKMMMDQLIRGPGFMPPPQARPPMAPNLIDHSPNSSNKVRSRLITTLGMLHRRVTLDEDSKAPFPGLVDHLSWHPARWTRSGCEGWVRNFNSGTREFENEVIVNAFMV
ncbi:hypothetical protein Sjap_005087 [Stephania japonica]|uniref:Uncharacterized protein n=1 Tax=Stephania japonica TaxID=461633 RepID=A0AAP0K4S7_9MAGN